MATVELRKVAKTYDGSTTIIHDIDLDINDGEFVVFVGPSGCGKSTLLRMIAGLESISSGELRIGNERVNDKPPRARDIAMVFQDYALYPHKSLYDNMAFGLRLHKTPEDEIKRRVMDAAQLLRIDTMLERRPAALSGGQRQRVAIGRAIVRQPKVFLFDEPLSNLDAQLRQEMRTEIKRLHERLGATMIYVTHDQVEAMTLAGRIAVLSAGRKMQYDTPDAIYNRPAALFVAGFTGAPPMNLIDANLNEGKADVGNGVRISLPPAFGSFGGPCKLGIRPENLRLAPEPGDMVVPASVALLEPLGSETLVTFKLGASEVIARVAASFRESSGTRVNLQLNPSHLHLFDSASGMALT